MTPLQLGTIPVGSTVQGEVNFEDLNGNLDTLQAGAAFVYVATGAASSGGTAVTLSAVGSGADQYRYKFSFTAPAASSYQIICTAGSVTSGNSVAGLVVAQFTTGLVQANAVQQGGSPIAAKPVYRSTQIAGVTADGVTDDAAAINTFLASAGPCKILVDGVHARKSASIKLYSGQELEGIDSEPRIINYGNTNLDCIVNANPRVSVPSMGSGSSFFGNPVVYPLQLSAAINSTIATSMTTLPYQGDLLGSPTGPTNWSMSGTPPSFSTLPQGGLHVLISDPNADSGNPGEIVLITAASYNATSHVTTYTIARGQLGSIATTHVANSVVTEWVIDEDIRLKNLTIDSKNFPGTTVQNSYTQYGFCTAMTFLGVRNLYLENVSVRDHSPGFKMLLGNIQGKLQLTGIDCRQNVANPLNGDDAVHFWGPIEKLVMRDCWLSGVDSPLAINIGENDFANWVAAAAINVAYQSAGNVACIDVDGLQATGTRGPIIGMLGAANETISRLTIKDALVRSPANSAAALANNPAIVEDYEESTTITTCLWENWTVETASNATPQGVSAPASVVDFKAKNFSFNWPAANQLVCALATPINASHVSVVGLCAPLAATVQSAAIIDGSLLSFIAQGFETSGTIGTCAIADLVAPAMPLLGLAGTVKNLLYSQIEVSGLYATGSVPPTAVTRLSPSTDPAGNVYAVDAPSVPAGENPAGTAAIAAATVPPAGAFACTIQTNNSSNVPVPGVTVFAMSAASGGTLVGGPATGDSGGAATIVLRPGTQWIWQLCNGYATPAPFQVTISEATTLTLNTLVPFAAPTVGTYAALGDLQNVFGIPNINKWALLSQNDYENPNAATYAAAQAEIANRVNWAIGVATADFENAMRQGRYTLPVTGSGASVWATTVVATLAGYLLYQHLKPVQRGEDGRPIPDRYDGIFTWAEQQMNFVRSGKLRLDAAVFGKGTNAPEATHERSHGAYGRGQYGYGTGPLPPPGPFVG